MLKFAPIPPPALSRATVCAAAPAAKAEDGSGVKVDWSEKKRSMERVETDELAPLVGRIRPGCVDEEDEEDDDVGFGLDCRDR